MFEVRISQHADRALAKLDADLVKRIEHAMNALKEDPFRPRSGADIKMLRGDRDYYRLRVGSHRVFYHVFPEQNVVVVVDVRHRSKAYD